MTANIDDVSVHIHNAAGDGADMITTPENSFFMGSSAKELFENAFFENKHPAILHMQELASKYNMWILIGSVAVKVENSHKFANRSIMINPKGDIAKTYDKIHLYNAQVKGGETHAESERYLAGGKTAICQSPWANIGMTICYDLRFPHLFRKLSQSGAKVITVPSAFTKLTG